MKWYIFKDCFDDEENKIIQQPLCWDEMALEFDTKDAAERFLMSAVGIVEPELLEGAQIKECIFYYDGGKVNVTNYEIVLVNHVEELHHIETGEKLCLIRNL